MPVPSELATVPDPSLVALFEIPLPSSVAILPLPSCPSFAHINLPILNSDS